MDAKNIIVQGETVKYILLIDRQDFSMSNGDFQVELRWGLQGQTKVIKKSEMMEASSGWLFSFSTDGMVGKVVAKCTWFYDDTDVSGAIRPETDEQIIAFVVTTPCPKFQACPKCTGDHDVTYTRIEESEITAKYERLVDCYDRPLITSDDCYIYALRDEENNNE